MQKNHTTGKVLKIKGWKTDSEELISLETSEGGETKSKHIISPILQLYIDVLINQGTILLLISGLRLWAWIAYSNKRHVLQAPPWIRASRSIGVQTETWRDWGLNTEPTGQGNWIELSSLSSILHVLIIFESSRCLCQLLKFSHWKLSCLSATVWEINSNFLLQKLMSHWAKMKQIVRVILWKAARYISSKLYHFQTGYK